MSWPLRATAANLVFVRVTILASGSGGNSCLVESGGTRVLVDAGLSARELERRLLARQVDPETIQALFLTHEHGDHSSGALSFGARWIVRSLRPQTRPTRSVWTEPSFLPSSAWTRDARAASDRSDSERWQSRTTPPSPSPIP